MEDFGCIVAVLKDLRNATLMGNRAKRWASLNHKDAPRVLSATQTRAALAHGDINESNEEGLRWYADDAGSWIQYIGTKASSKAPTRPFMESGPPALRGN